MHNKLLRNRIPQSVSSSFHKDPLVKIKGGYDFIKNIGVVPTESFDSGFGPILQESGKSVFFLTTPGHSFTPVARSRKTNTLYPLSSVIKVKGVSSSQRKHLLALGYKEISYLSSGQVLTLKANPSSLLNLYQDLHRDSFDVQLEVER